MCRVNAQPFLRCSTWSGTTARPLAASGPSRRPCARKCGFFSTLSNVITASALLFTQLSISSTVMAWESSRITRSGCARWLVIRMKNMVIILGYSGSTPEPASCPVSPETPISTSFGVTPDNGWNGSRATAADRHGAHRQFRRDRMHLPKTLFGALLALSIPCAALAQECGGDFSAWRAGVEAEAAAQGVGVNGLAALRSASFDQRIVNRDRA